MKKLMMVVLSLTCMAGVAVAGNIDSPGSPSAGSGMYTLQNLYDYLTSGTALTVPGSFQEPTAGPASTMKSTKQIGDDVSALFAQCDAAAANVQKGKKFFCTVAGNWGVKTGTAYKGNLLKTGQTSSYRTGDDGTYQKGLAFNYTDNGDGTISDNVTGLMWAKDGSAAGCYNGSVRTWTQAIDWAEALSFAGYTDWRLPNVTEGQTLLVRNSSIGAPYVNTTFFPNTAAASYWTSSTSPYNTAQADYTYPAQGNLYTNAKTYAFYVRAVRGGE